MGEAENNQDMVETILQHHRDIAKRKKIVAAYRASGFYNEEEMKEWERGIMGDVYYWMDKKAEELTLEEARDAVKALRRIVAKKITEPIKADDKKQSLDYIPAWQASTGRIDDLCKAMIRNVTSMDIDTGEIRKCAEEILYHCEIIANCL